MNGGEKWEKSKKDDKEGRRKRREKFYTRYKETLFGTELKEQGRLVSV